MDCFVICTFGALFFYIPLSYLGNESYEGGFSYFGLSILKLHWGLSNLTLFHRYLHTIMYFHRICVLREDLGRKINKKNENLNLLNAILSFRWIYRFEYCFPEFTNRKSIETAGSKVSGVIGFRAWFCQGNMLFTRHKIAILLYWTSCWELISSIIMSVLIQEVFGRYPCHSFWMVVCLII